MKQTITFLLLLVVLLVAVHCPAPTYPNWATTNQQPAVPSTTTYFTPSSTNTIIAYGWGTAAINGTYTYNPAFSVDNVVGAYTNSTGIAYIFNFGVSLPQGWNVITWNTRGPLFTGNNVPQNNLAFGQLDGSGAVGSFVFPQSANAYSGFIVQAPPLSGIHVYIATNGWTSPSGWVPETSAGKSLSDALTFYGLVNPTNQAAAVSNFSFYTNWTAAKFELGPAPPWVNPFYLPQGFTINNQVGSSSWEIYGQGPNTCILGDSNVLLNVVGNKQGQISIGGAIPYEYIHDLSFCVSNAAQKTVAVDMYGNGYLKFSHNYITAYISWNPTNYFLGWTGGDSGGTHTPPGYSAGFVDLILCGNNGSQWVDNNIFAGGVCGILCLSEHIRIRDNEYKFISTDTQKYQSQYSLSDTNIYYVGDATPVHGYELALGFAIMLHGSGDVEIDGDKDIDSNMGIYVSDGPVLYGGDLIRNFHAEALGSNTTDIVFNTNIFGVVTSEDCVDQQLWTHTALSWRAWTYSTNGWFTLSNVGQFQRCKAFVTGLYLANQNGAPNYGYFTNNIQAAQPW